MSSHSFFIEEAAVCHMVEECAGPVLRNDGPSFIPLYGGSFEKAMKILGEGLILAPWSNNVKINGVYRIDVVNTYFLLEDGYPAAPMFPLFVSECRTDYFFSILSSVLPVALAEAVSNTKINLSKLLSDSSLYNSVREITYPASTEKHHKQHIPLGLVVSPGSVVVAYALSIDSSIHPGNAFHKRFTGYHPLESLVDFKLSSTPEAKLEAIDMVLVNHHQVISKIIEAEQMSDDTAKWSKAISASVKPI
jgi:hypothetical protein